MQLPPDDIKEAIKSLQTYSSTRELLRSELFKKHQNYFNAQCNYQFWLNTSGSYSRKGDILKVAAWNIERGRHFNALVHILKNDPILKEADVLFLTEVDIGMARSGNRNVAECLAKELGMNVFYANSYFCFSKGAREELLSEGENLKGLHGNAILSRYELKDVRTISLFNCTDKFRGREKRIGCQKALVTQIKSGDRPINIVCSHLDAKSSPRQRARQMQIIMKQLDKRGILGIPTVIGGDWNTSTYNAKSKFSLVFSGLYHYLTVGPEKLTKHHYRHPYEKMEPLFRVLDKHGFRYLGFNEDGEGTIPYHTDDSRENSKAFEWLPKPAAKWMIRVTEKLGGHTSMKLDWIAGHKCQPIDGTAKVLPLQFWENEKVSDHQPIVVDIKL